MKNYLIVTGKKTLSSYSHRQMKYENERDMRDMISFGGFGYGKS